jgi:hypothetical protein
MPVTRNLTSRRRRAGHGSPRLDFNSSRSA